METECCFSTSTPTREQRRNRSLSPTTSCGTSSPPASHIEENRQAQEGYSSSTKSSASKPHWEHQQKLKPTNITEQVPTEAREPEQLRNTRLSSETDRYRPRSRYQNEQQERGHQRRPSPRSRQMDCSSKERPSRRARSKPTSRRNSPTLSDGVERRSRNSVSHYFECTRHNVRRAWSRWQDAGASVQVLEWIRHGVSIPWLPEGPPSPFNDGISCQRLPQDQDTFLKEEIARLKEKGV